MRGSIAHLLFASVVACIATADAASAARRGRPARPAEQQQPPQQEKQFPLKTFWILKQFNGKPVNPGDPPTLTLDDNFRGTGFGGCNTWSATIYPQRGQRLGVGPVALTRKACEPARMALERGFLAAVHAAPAWDLVNGDLALKSRAGTLLFSRSF